MTQSLKQPQMWANLTKQLTGSTWSHWALMLSVMVRLTQMTCLHAKGQHTMRRCVACTATLYYLLIYASIICLAEACSNSPKMTGSVTTSAVRMWPALHHVKSIIQVLQPLKSMSGLTVRRHILYLHAKACYRANRTIDFYSDGKLLPFMVIGREGGSSDGLSEFWGPCVFYFICASPLVRPIQFCWSKRSNLLKHQTNNIKKTWDALWLLIQMWWWWWCNMSWACHLTNKKYWLLTSQWVFC